VTDTFLAKVDTMMNYSEQLAEVNRQYHIELVGLRPYSRDVYVLRVTRDSPFNALDMANLYHELEYIEFAEPNFIMVIIRKIPGNKIIDNFQRRVKP